MRFTLFAMLFGLVAASPAQAQNWNCSQPDTLPQQGMNWCAHQDWKAADAELNRVYKLVRSAMKRLDRDMPADLKAAATALRDAQRAWITYRDKACAAEGFLFRGGTMEPLIVSGCMAELTRRRTQDLGFLLEGVQ